MDGRSATQPVGYPPSQIQHSSSQAESDEPEYARQPDIATGGGPPGYPPAQTAPIQRNETPQRDYWTDTGAKPAAGGQYAVPQGYGYDAGPSAGYTPPYHAQVSSPGRGPPGASDPDASSSGYPFKPDTVLQMGRDRPTYGEPSGNVADAPYSRPVTLEAPNRRPSRTSGGSVPAPYEGDRWEQDVRRGFVRKVLLLVAIQLLITTGVSIAFFTIQPIKDYLAENQWPVWVCLILSFAILFTIVCFPQTHKFPFDYMLLFGFTIFFSGVVGAITGRYSVQAVGLALAVTCATVFGAFFVAAFTKMDLTKIGGFLTAVLFGVIAMSIIGIFWRNKWFHFAIALVSAILFTMFLIYDLQMLMGGRSRQFDPDMYVIAALNIYIDIIQIFLNVLQIIGLVGGGE